MKKVVFQVDTELFRQAKVRAIQTDKNMTQYLVSLIEKDLRDDKQKEKS